MKGNREHNTFFESLHRFIPSKWNPALFLSTHTLKKGCAHFTCPCCGKAVLWGCIVSLSFEGMVKHVFLPACVQCWHMFMNRIMCEKTCTFRAFLFLCVCVCSTLHMLGSWEESGTVWHILDAAAPQCFWFPHFPFWDHLCAAVLVVAGRASSFLE